MHSQPQISRLDQPTPQHYEHGRPTVAHDLAPPHLETLRSVLHVLEAEAAWDLITGQLISQWIVKIPAPSYLHVPLFPLGVLLLLLAGARGGGEVLQRPTPGRSSRTRPWSGCSSGRTAGDDGR